jgi:hypothetical protein
MKEPQGKAFKSLDSLSNGIHYMQAAIASVSGLLLLLGLVTASTNLLTKDWLFGTWPWLQYAWAFDQAIAVDANLALIGMMFFTALDNREWSKVAIYSLIGGMLLFVAAVIMDIESVRQALDITLADASLRVHVSLEVLTQLRSWVVVLLVIMSGKSTVSLFSHAKQAPPDPVAPAEHTPPEAPSPLSPVVPAVLAKQEKVKPNGHTPTEDTYTRYQELIAVTPKDVATRPWLAEKLGVSPSTISNYRRKSKNEHDELEVVQPTPTPVA